MSQRLNKLLFSRMRDVNLRYGLISDGDRIAVGMSGGKDSMALLSLLLRFRRYTPLQFTLTPVCLDLGFGNDISELMDYCRQQSLELIVHPTDIAEIVFELRQEQNPCALCAHLRRGALNRIAKELSCNKVALGHHLDDVVNTWLLSLLYEGQFHVFRPKTWLDRREITVIRPLVYIEEELLKRYVEEEGLKPVINRCPADGGSKRAEVSALLEQLASSYPDIRHRILSAIEHADHNSFWIS
ncbi:MAG: ATP-binding protein [Syntrophomonadaceae bacterium]|nr:ATP-binding protein [Syntrophomonadaceae bacterium]